MEPQSPKARVLIVDDEKVNRNVLRDRMIAEGHEPILAEDGPAAFALIEESMPDLILLDILMPGMDGYAVLDRLKADPELAPIPVIVISALDDVESVVRCIEQGADDYLTKPFNPVLLRARIGNSLEKYRLIKAERELLEKTLTGSVQALADILSMASPEAFGEALTLRETVRDLAGKMKIKDPWELEIAAMLWRVGLVTLPPELSARLRSHEDLSEVEENLLERVPGISHDLLSSIPRLESLSRIILYHAKGYDGSGFPHDAVAGKDIPLGARILKILRDMNRLESSGYSAHGALEAMRDREGSYDPEVFESISAHYGFVAPARPKPPAPAVAPVPAQEPATVVDERPVRAHGPVENVEVDDLKEGSVLAGELMTEDGHLLLSRGERITRALLARIKNYEDLKGIRRPITVEISEEA